MSEPTRYEYSNGNNYWGHFINPKTQHFAPYGEYVRYADYARLKAEVERLEKEVWRMKVFKGIDEDTIATLKDALNTVPEWSKVLETEAENARLKAEVERLTKAGDAMADNCEAMASSEYDSYDSDLMKFVKAWNAAKKGGQP